MANALVPRPFAVAPATLILGLTLLLAAALRLAAVQWGLPSAAHPEWSFHPDEAAMLVWGQWIPEGVFRPLQFIFGGTLYLSLYNACVTVAETWPTLFGGYNLMADGVLAMRLLNSAAAIASIALLYASGRRLFGAGTGALAALILAVLPAHVLLTPTARPDSLGALASTVFLYLAVRMFTSRPEDDRREFVLNGFTLGIVLALRFPIAAFAVAPALAYMMRNPPRTREAWAHMLRHALLALLVAGTTYLVCSPHSVFHFSLLLDGLASTYEYESSIFPDAVDRGPRIYQYGWGILRDAMSVPLHLATLAALVLLATRGQATHRLLLASMIPYAVMMLSASWVVVRYTLPLLPWLALVLAAASMQLVGESRRRAIFGIGILAAALTWAILHAGAMIGLQRGIDVRDQAAHWIDESVPAGSHVVRLEQYVGDVYLNPPLIRHQYRSFPLKPGYDPRMLADHPEAPYIVVHENIYANMERLRDDSPAEIQALLALLESGRYELANAFKLPVTILGIDFSDRFTSLDFRVINPGIRIYRRRDS